jgi:hypothetical protein
MRVWRFGGRRCRGGFWIEFLFVEMTVVLVWEKLGEGK